ncbi:TPA: cadmium-translocating P-type ATPase [Candidatus Uhrbacteria bacterium]|nr:cadmium-translocating P-type ATPase [Candidatus Uhrbacteria bacterium]
MSSLLAEPTRDYIILGLIVATFCVDLIFHWPLTLFIIAGLAVIPTFWNTAKAARHGKITIDTFNTFAVIVSFATGEAYSAIFIALMLTCARLLDWYTESRTHHAIEELLRLKPTTAVLVQGDVITEVDATTIKSGDVVLVKSGARLPVDGIVIDGYAHVNESLVTGESEPIEKNIGDRVVSASLVDIGTLHVRATQVGKDSTLERMATLMHTASLHKSTTEKLADRFAAIFLPLVGLLGALTYAINHDLRMTAALFLIACADDMAVAIPLAMTASLGAAAKRGVIIKGGQTLDALSRMKTLVLDKTGTLTFGNLSIRAVHLAPSVDETHFWTVLASTEKYSEHPAGRTAYQEGLRRLGTVADPTDFKLYKGKGVVAQVQGEEIIAGTEMLFNELGLPVPTIPDDALGSVFWVASNGQLLGSVEVADIPRPEAAASLHHLRELGITRIVMLTGDNERVAKNVANLLGITEYHSRMTPEGKLLALEELLKDGPVGMVGDGINDAPALARADIGIAMGGGGAAVSVEAADVVIMTDNLARLPQMILLGRSTLGVVKGDIAIWVVSNLVGFILVFTGLVGPALAAFYNFATDFFPLFNSSRLFKSRKTGRL